MNEKTRIEKIILAEGMTSGQFAQEIGVQNSTLSHILNSRNNPSLDVIKKILNRFPIVNSDWLILGQGPMYRQESHSPTPSLFGFEEESDSLSIDIDDNFTKKTDVEFVSSGRNLENQAEKSDESHRLVSEQPLIDQTNKSGIKIDTRQLDGKKATKIILYYSDNTFQEFESK